jgi:hypothetical protein
MVDLWELLEENYVRSEKKKWKNNMNEKRHDGDEQKMERVGVFWEV